MGYHVLQSFLDEQAGVCICSRLGHSWRIILPVQKHDESREVYVLCATCKTKGWLQFPEDGYQKFLKDLAAGKIENPPGGAI